MDVDEFFNMFMDKLEGLLQGKPQSKIIQKHFGGKFANELIFQGTPYFSERPEPFLAVSL